MEFKQEGLIEREIEIAGVKQKNVSGAYKKYDGKIKSGRCADADQTIKGQIYLTPTTAYPPMLFNAFLL